jgi:hypothetical protein
MPERRIATVGTTGTPRMRESFAASTTCTTAEGSRSSKASRVTRSSSENGIVLRTPGVSMSGRVFSCTRTAPDAISTVAPGWFETSTRRPVRAAKTADLPTFEFPTRTTGASFRAASVADAPWQWVIALVSHAGDARRQSQGSFDLLAEGRPAPQGAYRGRRLRTRRRGVG